MLHPLRRHSIHQVNIISLLPFHPRETLQPLLQMRFVKLLFKAALLTPYLLLVDVLQSLPEHVYHPFVLGLDVL